MSYVSGSDNDTVPLYFGPAGQQSLHNYFVLYEWFRLNVLSKDFAAQRFVLELKRRSQAMQEL